MKIKKLVYVVVGCLSVGLGAVGAVRPMLPAFPFLLLAAFCFGKSSEKLHTWFIGTKLYRDNLESYVQGKGMTRKTKIRIMVTVTLLMSIGFFIMCTISSYPDAIMEFHISTMLPGEGWEVETAHPRSMAS